jgi:ribonucleotide reductase beta subunit family protein with ferritin-like domain
MQRAYYEGVFKKDREEAPKFEEITVEEVMEELLCTTVSEESEYKDEYLRERLGIIINSLEEDP